MGIKHTFLGYQGRWRQVCGGSLSPPRPFVLLMDGRPPPRPRTGPKRSIRSLFRIDMISRSLRYLQVRRTPASTRLVATPSSFPIDFAKVSAAMTSRVEDRAGAISRVARNLNTFDTSSIVCEARLHPKQDRIGQFLSRWDGRTRRLCWW